MRIALIVLEAFNEIDSLLACTLLNRVRAPGWEVALVSPEAEVVSMNGVRLQAQQPLAWAAEADAVLFGSGRLSRDLSAQAKSWSRSRPCQQIRSTPSKKSQKIRIGTAKAATSKSDGQKP